MLLSILAFVTLIVFFTFATFLFYRIFHIESEKDNETHNNLKTDITHVIDKTNESLISLTDGLSSFNRIAITDNNGNPAFINFDKGKVSFGDTKCISVGKSIICDNSIDTVDVAGKYSHYEVNGLSLGAQNSNEYGLEENNRDMRLYAPSKDASLSIGFNEGDKYRNVVSVSSKDTLGSANDLSTINGDLYVTGNIKSKEINSRFLTAQESQDSMYNKIQKVMQESNLGMIESRQYMVTDLQNQINDNKMLYQKMYVDQESKINELNLSINASNLAMQLANLAVLSSGVKSETI